MTMPIIGITDCETGDEIIREMTAEEYGVFQEAEETQRLMDEEAAQQTANRAAVLAALAAAAGLDIAEVENALA